MHWILDLFHLKSIAPNFWLNYEEHFKTKPDPDQKLEEITFTVFDCESTGLNPGSDRILSIGAIKVKALRIRIQDSFDEKVNPMTWEDFESIKVHEILPNTLIDEQDEIQALSKFLSFIKDDILVAHNAFFDISIINETLKRTIGKKLKNGFLDTAIFEKRLRKKQMSEASDQPDASLSLDALCEQYNIDVENRHDASIDAYVTALILCKQLFLLKTRGVKKRSDLNVLHRV